ncbi:unnamed protein product [Timema podura]|uniref:Uncharacterized protein n=1 Tax=Timema podura TaxID=61482 RepID=A0ABN7NUC0_TIMPD|nr:unnamed protein product [Timema podura]
MKTFVGVEKRVTELGGVSRTICAMHSIPPLRRNLMSKWKFTLWRIASPQAECRSHAWRLPIIISACSRGPLRTHVLLKSGMRNPRTTSHYTNSDGGAMTFETRDH